MQRICWNMRLDKTHITYTACVFAMCMQFMQVSIHLIGNSSYVSTKPTKHICAHMFFQACSFTTNHICCASSVGLPCTLGLVVHGSTVEIRWANVTQELPAIPKMIRFSREFLDLAEQYPSPLKPFSWISPLEMAETGVTFFTASDWDFRLWRLFESVFYSHVGFTSVWVIVPQWCVWPPWHEHWLRWWRDN